MFNLGGLRDLAHSLGLSHDEIKCVLDDFEANPSSLVSELTLWRADTSKKPRDVICVRRKWREIQQRIYTKLLLPRFRPSRYSHGGVKRRSAMTNARAHVGNAYAFVADISNFFPSISCFPVNRLFLQQACSYDVARILTRLCTFDYHLALGLVTSPIIANELFKPIDARIAAACKKMNLVYSRFVDDITISGTYDLERSGIESVVRQIIRCYGFRLAPGKTDWGRFDSGLSVTGICLKNGHIDASRSFIRELDRLIADHASLAQNAQFDGPLLTESELFGKAHYACALNPGRRRTILAKLKDIDWSAVMNNAVDRNLCRSRDRLVPRGAPRPDCTESLAMAEGTMQYRAFCAANAIDHSVAPFDLPT